MSRPGYPYPPGSSSTTTSTTTRHVSNHGTSSAFSSSANPDEDWTKISDLAERRRIQNRIAQRNYRKKLKRRLEDLERRAGSSSVSPPQSHAKLTSPRTHETQTHKRSPEMTTTVSQPPRAVDVRPSMPHQYSPPVQSEGEFQMLSSTSQHGYEDRDGSRSPPTLFSNTQYPPPEEPHSYPPYHTHPYRHISYGAYSQPQPMTLPVISFTDTLKREPHDTLQPYHMNYHSPGAIMDLPPSAYGYDDGNAMTPPLSSSWDHPVAESNYAYPHTPLSMPPSSPQLVHA